MKGTLKKLVDERFFNGGCNICQTEGGDIPGGGPNDRMPNIDCCGSYFCPNPIDKIMHRELQMNVV